MYPYRSQFGGPPRPRGEIPPSFPQQNEVGFPYGPPPVTQGAGALVQGTAWDLTYPPPPTPDVTPQPSKYGNTTKYVTHGTFEEILQGKDWKRIYGKLPSLRQYEEYQERINMTDWLKLCGRIPEFADYIAFHHELDSRDWIALCRLIPTFKDYVDFLEKMQTLASEDRCDITATFRDYVDYFIVGQGGKKWADSYNGTITFAHFLLYSKQRDGNKWKDCCPNVGTPLFHDYLRYVEFTESKDLRVIFGRVPSFTEYMEFQEMKGKVDYRKECGITATFDHLLEYKEHSKSRDWLQFCGENPTFKDYLTYLGHENSVNWRNLKNRYNDKPYFTDYMKFLQISVSKNWEASGQSKPTFDQFIEYLILRASKDWKKITGRIPTFFDYTDYVQGTRSKEWAALRDRMPSFQDFIMDRSFEESVDEFQGESHRQSGRLSHSRRDNQKLANIKESLPKQNAEDFTRRWIETNDLGRYAGDNRSRSPTGSSASYSKARVPGTREIDDIGAMAADAPEPRWLPRQPSPCRVMERARGPTAAGYPPSDSQRQEWIRVSPPSSSPEPVYYSANCPAYDLDAVYYEKRRPSAVPMSPVPHAERDPRWTPLFTYPARIREKRRSPNVQRQDMYRRSRERLPPCDQSWTSRRDGDERENDPESHCSGREDPERHRWQPYSPGSERITERRPPSMYGHPRPELDEGRSSPECGRKLSAGYERPLSPVYRRPAHEWERERERWCSQEPQRAAYDRDRRHSQDTQWHARYEHEYHGEGRPSRRSPFGQRTHCSFERERSFSPTGYYHRSGRSQRSLSRGRSYRRRSPSPYYRRRHWSPTDRSRRTRRTRSPMYDYRAWSPSIRTRRSRSNASRSRSPVRGSRSHTRRSRSPVRRSRSPFWRKRNRSKSPLTISVKFGDAEVPKRRIKAVHRRSRSHDSHPGCCEGASADRPAFDDSMDFTTDLTDSEEESAKENEIDRDQLRKLVSGFASSRYDILDGRNDRLDLECPIDGCELKGLAALRLHAQQEHGIVVSRFRCFRCAFDTDLVDMMTDHLKYKHKMKVQTELVMELLAKTRVEEIKDQRYRVYLRKELAIRRQGSRHSPDRHSKASKEVGRVSDLTDSENEGSKLEVLCRKKLIDLINSTRTCGNFRYDILDAANEESLFVCPLDNCACFGMTSYRKHAQYVHGVALSTYRCFRCVFETELDDMMSDHLKYKHKLKVETDLVRDCLGKTRFENIKDVRFRNCAIIKGYALKTVSSGDTPSQIKCHLCELRVNDGKELESHIAANHSSETTLEEKKGEGNLERATVFRRRTSQSSKAPRERTPSREEKKPAKYSGRQYISVSPKESELCFKKSDGIEMSSEKLTQNRSLRGDSPGKDTGSRHSSVREAEPFSYEREGHGFRASDHVEITCELCKPIVRTFFGLDSLTKHVLSEHRKSQSNLASTRDVDMRHQSDVRHHSDVDLRHQSDTDLRTTLETDTELLKLMKQNKIHGYDIEEENTNPSHGCKLCEADDKLYGITDLRSHLYAQHGKNCTSFRCVVCGLDYPVSAAMVHHLRFKHNVTVSEEMVDKILAVTDLRKVASRRDETESAQNVSSGKASVVTEEELLDILKSSPVEGYDVLESSEARTLHPCGFCRPHVTEILGVSNLRQHVWSVHGKALVAHRCFHCGLDYRSPEAMSRHLEVKHRENVYPCLVAELLVVTQVDKIQNIKSAPYKAEQDKSEASRVLSDGKKVHESVLLTSREHILQAVKKTKYFNKYDTHNAKNEELQITCDLCKPERETLTGISTFKEHLRSVHGREALMGRTHFLCFCCGASHRVAKELSRHLAASHNYKLSVELCWDNLAVTACDVMTEDNLSVTVCDVVTEDGRRLPVSVTRDNVMQHIVESRIKEYDCLQPKSEEYRQVRCPLCTAGEVHITGVVNMRKHLMEVHQRNSCVYRCFHCGQDYGTVDLLASHCSQDHKVTIEADVVAAFLSVTDVTKIFNTCPSDSEAGEKRKENRDRSQGAKEDVNKSEGAKEDINKPGDTKHDVTKPGDANEDFNMSEGAQADINKSECSGADGNKSDGADEDVNNSENIRMTRSKSKHTVEDVNKYMEGTDKFEGASQNDGKGRSNSEDAKKNVIQPVRIRRDGSKFKGTEEDMDMSDGANDETSKREGAKEDTDKSEGTSEEISKREGAKRDMDMSVGANEETSKCEGAKEDIDLSMGANEETSKREGAKEDTDKSEGTNEETSKREGAKEDTDKSEGTNEEISKREGAKEDTDKSVGASEETSKREGAKEDTVISEEALVKLVREGAMKGYYVFSKDDEDDLVVCKLCSGCRTYSLVQLKEHLQEKHKKDCIVYRCFHCNVEYPVAAAMSHHLRFKHASLVDHDLVTKYLQVTTVRKYAETSDIRDTEVKPQVGKEGTICETTSDEDVLALLQKCDARVYDVLRIETEENQITCNVCSIEKGYDLVKFTEHVETEHGQKRCTVYRCCFCGLEYPVAEAMTQHLRFKHERVISPAQVLKYLSVTDVHKMTRKLKESRGESLMLGKAAESKSLDGEEKVIKTEGSRDTVTKAMTDDVLLELLKDSGVSDYDVLRRATEHDVTDHGSSCASVYRCFHCRLDYPVAAAMAHHLKFKHGTVLSNAQVLSYLSVTKVRGLVKAGTDGKDPGEGATDSASKGKPSAEQLQLPGEMKKKGSAARQALEALVTASCCKEFDWIKDRAVDPIVCTLCREEKGTFPGCRELRGHIENDHGVTTATYYRCPSCEYDSSEQLYVTRHLKGKHNLAINFSLCEEYLAVTDLEKYERTLSVKYVHEETGTYWQSVVPANLKLTEKVAIVGVDVEIPNADGERSAGHCKPRNNTEVTEESLAPDSKSSQVQETFQKPHKPEPVNLRSKLLAMISRSAVTGYDVLREADDAVVVCQRCDENEPVKLSLRQVEGHLKTVHVIDISDVVSYKCFMCGFDDVTVSSVVKHLKEKHGFTINFELCKQYLAVTDLTKLKTQSKGCSTAKVSGQTTQAKSTEKTEKSSETGSKGRVMGRAEMEAMVKGSQFGGYDVLKSQVSTCQICRDEGTSASTESMQMRRHFEEVHALDRGKFCVLRCCHCGFQDSDAANMTLHVKVKHYLAMNVDLCREYLSVSDIDKAIKALQSSKGKEDSIKASQLTSGDVHDSSPPAPAKGARKTRKRKHRDIEHADLSNVNTSLDDQTSPADKRARTRMRTTRQSAVVLTKGNKGTKGTGIVVSATKAKDQESVSNSEGKTQTLHCGSAQQGKCVSNVTQNLIDLSGVTTGLCAPNEGQIKVKVSDSDQRTVKALTPKTEEKPGDPEEEEESQAVVESDTKRKGEAARALSRNKNKRKSVIQQVRDASALASETDHCAKEDSEEATPARRRRSRGVVKAAVGSSPRPARKCKR